MMKRKYGALAVAGLLAITACGGDDENGSDDTAEENGADDSVEDAAGADSGPDSDGEADMDDEAESGNEAAASDDEAGSMGDGYRIDASTCPADASEPLADGEPIKLGITLTMTGPGSAPQLAEGVDAYLNKINAEEGGIDGHPFELIVKDDAFDAARAVANITEFIQSDGIFAMAAQQGSANIVATQPVIEESCIPQFFVPAGLPAFGDPDNHPFTSSGQMAYDTEAELWAEYLNENYPDGGKAALLVFNSSFGTDYVDALEAALEGTPHEIVETKLHEATAVNVNNEITALAAASPDVMFGATAGQACTQMMTAAATVGFDGDVVMSSLCIGIESFFAPAAEAADGVLMIQSFKDPADPAFADDAEVQAYIADIEAYGAEGIEPLNGFVSAGYRNAAMLVHAMKEAAASEDGLTRIGVANAAWNIDFVAPLAHEGIRVTMSGSDDAYPVESGTMFAFDAAEGTMVSTGLTLAAEGQAGSFGE